MSTRPRTISTDHDQEARLLVAIIILGLVELSIVGLSRLSDKRHTDADSSGTSLRRTAASHINAHGSPKRGYVSMDAARVAAGRQTANTGQPMSAYRCGTCKIHHIGHA